MYKATPIWYARHLPQPQAAPPASSPRAGPPHRTVRRPPGESAAHRLPPRCSVGFCGGMPVSSIHARCSDLAAADPGRARSGTQSDRCPAVGRGLLSTRVATINRHRLICHNGDTAVRPRAAIRSISGRSPAGASHSISEIGRFDTEVDLVLGFQFARGRSLVRTPRPAEILAYCPPNRVFRWNAGPSAVNSSRSCSLPAPPWPILTISPPDRVVFSAAGLFAVNSSIECPLPALSLTDLGGFTTGKSLVLGSLITCGQSLARAAHSAETLVGLPPFPVVNSPRLARVGLEGGHSCGELTACGAGS